LEHQSYISAASCDEVVAKINLGIPSFAACSSR
jgi:hypothetical protein